MFEELEKTLIDIKNELSLVRQLFVLTMDSITTKKQVAKFLCVSTKTIDNYITDGRFQKNVHYFLDHNDVIVFIPESILMYKKERKNNKIEKLPQQIHPISNKFLQNKGMKVG
jgi:predicted DNA-binding transcriptional regulator AlpA